jgi:hypothetical protein
MNLGDRLRKFGKELSEPHADGRDEVHVGDPAFDDWPVVRDFEELETARAWCQQLNDQGIEAQLTSDHPLSERGFGDIALRVPPDRWADASNALEPD